MEEEMKITSPISPISNSWHSYPSPKALGHKAVENLFLDEVVIEEKIDGSQFSFGVINGILRCKSKSAELNLIAPEKMFIKAIEAVKGVEHLLTPNWTYRAEYLAKPKHNSLAYDRIPTNHLMIFDINTGHEEYLDKESQRAEAVRLGFEFIPIIHQGVVTNLNVFRDMLSTVSVLGGQNIEGVVVKNTKQFGTDGKILIGKYVSEHFKEVHTKEWGKSNPAPKDIITKLIDEYRTPARYQKAVQHLRERGEITDTPVDIGKIISEASSDIHKECADEIKDKLFNFFWDRIRRGAVAGVPTWYKEQLLLKQFEGES